MTSIEFPITVNAIEFGEDKPIMPPLFRGKPGDFVKIRPCGKEYGGKTYLGIMIGDVALSLNVRFYKETGKLVIDRTMHNPGILVPALQKVIYGAESWWGIVKSADDLLDITDEDINSVWYVQALKAMAEKQEEATTD